MPETKLSRDGQEKLHGFVHHHMDSCVNDANPTVRDFAEEFLSQLDKAHADGELVPYLRAVGRMLLNKRMFGSTA